MISTLPLTEKGGQAVLLLGTIFTRARTCQHFYPTAYLELLSKVDFVLITIIHCANCLGDFQCEGRMQHLKHREEQ